jgi:hypothetical protein
MSTPIKVTKEQIRKKILGVAERYRGEPPEWRYGYLCALHDIAEDDGDEMKCDHYNAPEQLEAFFKLIGKDYQKVKE